MAPIVHGLEAEYTGRVIFSYLDIDDPATQEIKQALGYRVQPHFFLLDGDGNLLKQWLGRVSAEEFATEFDAALAQ
jgi:thioredoxin-like negative regulator of GroEL